MAKPEIILIGGNAYRGGRLANSAANGALPSHGSLPCRAQGRPPSGDRAVRCWSLRRADCFRGHARAPIKRGMIATSPPTRHAARPAPPSQYQALGRGSLFRRGTRALAAHFSDDPSINKSVTSGFEFRGVCPRARRSSRPLASAPRRRAKGLCSSAPRGGALRGSL